MGVITINKNESHKLLSTIGTNYIVFKNIKKFKDKISQKETIIILNKNEEPFEILWRLKMESSKLIKYLANMCSRHQGTNRVPIFLLYFIKKRNLENELIIQQMCPGTAPIIKK